MTYVIAEPCVGVCDTACVDVCPVDCIHGPNDKEGRGQEVEALKAGDGVKGLMLYIDPDECIDCGACEPECPEEAIFEEDDVPDKWEKYTQINADFFK